MPQLIDAVMSASQSELLDPGGAIQEIWNTDRGSRRLALWVQVKGKGLYRLPTIQTERPEETATTGEATWDEDAQGGENASSQGGSS